MKNISLIINAVLVIAVSVLFYQVHTLKTSGNNQAAENQGQRIAGDSIVTPSKIALNEEGPSNLADAKIAFVNIDSINSKYLEIADYSKKMKAQVQVLENSIESLTATFQSEYESYQQSAQAGIASQSDLMKAEEGLKRKDQEIKNKQIQLQNLQYDQQDKIVELNEKLQQVVDKYNNGRFDYVISYSEALPLLVFKNKKLDISNDVVKILNEEYMNSKNSKSKK